MKNKLIRKYVYLHFLRVFHYFIIIFCFWFLIILYALIRGTIVGVPDLYEGIMNGILASLIFLGIILVPFSIVTSFYIIRFIRVIKYQEKKYNIAFNDTNAKYITSTPELFNWKVPYFLCDEWFIASGSCAFYYKDIQKVKLRKKRSSLIGGWRYFKYTITSSNGKKYSFCTSSTFLNILNKWRKAKIESDSR